MATINKSVQNCIKSFQDHGNAEKAQQQKRYLKSPFLFYGISKPFINECARRIKRENAHAGQNIVVDICLQLWTSEYHDQKTLAIELLKTYKKYIDDQALPLIDQMIDESKGWDLIDNIAIWLVGELIRKDRSKHQLIDQWSRSENFWRRRAAIISPIKLFRQKKCDLDLYFRIWKDHFSEKEFFIRKAIGWVLRELAKHEPELVFDFVIVHRKEMSGLTAREAVKNLPGRQKKRIFTEQ